MSLPVSMQNYGLYWKYIVSLIFVLALLTLFSSLNNSNSTIKHISMINDVWIEILVRVPVESLLRFRTVCRFWRDSIDSEPFRKLHTQNDNKSRDMVYLQLCQPRKQNEACLEVRLGTKELSMKLQHKNNNSYESNRFTSYLKSYWPCHVVVGAVEGLIFINPHDLKVPIAICNPFLGQLKILPPSSSPSCDIVFRNVAIGFDEDEDYKVVQLQHCKNHECLHAQLYSRRTDSWRELAGDNRVLDDMYNVGIKPIKSRCKNGNFLHWSLYTDILSLDMKNEVFQRFRSRQNFYASSIFAEDEHSFQGFAFKNNGFNIHELICEGSELSLNYAMAGKVRTSNSEVPLWRNDCVIFEDVLGTFVYDQRAHTVISKHSGLPKG